MGARRARPRRTGTATRAGGRRATTRPAGRALPPDSRSPGPSSPCRRTGAGPGEPRRRRAGRRAPPSPRRRARTVGLQAERVERSCARRDEDALRLQVEVERLEPELAAEAGLLVAAERDPRERRVRHVDPDAAALDPGRDAMAAGGIAGPD